MKLGMQRLDATARGLWVLAAIVAAGCPSEDGDSAGDTSGAATSAATEAATGGSAATDDGADASADATDSSGADSTGGGGDGAVAALFAALPGLWVAPVTSSTSAGDFAMMTMDIRPADDRTLFGRVDLDNANNLRFAFALETHDGVEELVFRNGGYFLGTLRDTRTRLVEHDAAAGTWRFCAIGGAECDYVDAVFTLGNDMLDLEVEVLGVHHMHWGAALAEARPQPGEFPVDPSPGGSDDPFPTMPQLDVSLSWTEPAAAPFDAWVLLMTTACGINPVGCTPSRFVRTTVEVGATSAALSFEQIHAGEYFGFAVLDRNGNLQGALVPDAGDGVSAPDQPVTVGAEGTSTKSIAILLDL
jgi:hypothetical protein